MIFSEHEVKTYDDCMNKIICNVQNVRWYQAKFEALVF
jgi:hypothetical protein